MPEQTLTRAERLDLIDEAEARRRRDAIQDEADFYGAMDGASKFVRGDAIAGILITLPNFGEERGLADAVRLSDLNVPVLVQAFPDEVGKMTIAGGRYAFARFELKPDEYAEAWNAVMGGWLPESGLQPADVPCFQLYHNDCNEHPEKKAIVDICIPVVPL